MIVYVAKWFPNTQANLNRLLNIMKDYDDDGFLFDIINNLIDDLKNPKLFIDRPNIKQPTFNKMLYKNIDKLIEYGGKL